MHNIVEKYGKQPIEQLMNEIIINERVDKDWAYSFALQHRFITKSTKTVRPLYSKTPIREWKTNQGYVVTGDIKHHIYFRNGSNKIIFEVRFLESEIPQILEDCRE